MLPVSAILTELELSFFLPAQFWNGLEWDSLGQLFQVRPTPISHGDEDVAETQTSITYLSLVASSAEAAASSHADSASTETT